MVGGMKGARETVRLHVNVARRAHTYPNMSQQQPSMQHFVIRHFAVVRAWLLLGILGVWCVCLGGHGGVAAFAVPGRLQQQRLLGGRSCLSRDGAQSKRRCVLKLPFWFSRILPWRFEGLPGRARFEASLTAQHENVSRLWLA